MLIRRLLHIGLLHWFLPALAFGVTSEVTVGDVHLRLFAPDWIWQNQSVNILMVVSNPTSSEHTLSVNLELPDAAPGELTYIAPTTQQHRIAANSELRLAFTGLKPSTGFPLTTYDCQLIVTATGASVTIPYQFHTVRGPAVKSGILMALAPVGISLIWCVMFLIFLPRLATPGAWRVSSDTFVAEDKPA
jgi:hypothetical protein